MNLGHQAVESDSQILVLPVEKYGDEYSCELSTEVRVLPIFYNVHNYKAQYKRVDFSFHFQVLTD